MSSAGVRGIALFPSPQQGLWLSNHARLFGVLPEYVFPSPQQGLWLSNLFLIEPAIRKDSTFRPLSPRIAQRDGAQSVGSARPLTQQRSLLLRFDAVPESFRPLSEVTGSATPISTRRCGTACTTFRPLSGVPGLATHIACKAAVPQFV